MSGYYTSLLVSKYPTQPPTGEKSQREKKVPCPQTSFERHLCPLETTSRMAGIGSNPPPAHSPDLSDSHRLFHDKRNASTPEANRKNKTEKRNIKQSRPQRLALASLRFAMTSLARSLCSLPFACCCVALISLCSSFFFFFPTLQSPRETESPRAGYPMNQFCCRMWTVPGPGKENRKGSPRNKNYTRF